jgi:hypothetical protein
MVTSNPDLSDGLWSGLKPNLRIFLKFLTGHLVFSTPLRFFLRKVGETLKKPNILEP